MARVIDIWTLDHMDFFRKRVQKHLQLRLVKWFTLTIVRFHVLYKIFNV